MRQPDIALAAEAASIFAELRTLVLADPAGAAEFETLRVAQTRDLMCGDQDAIIAAAELVSGGPELVTRLRSAWWALAMTGMRFAFRQGNRHAEMADRDDASQAGMIGLYEAARRYDPSRGVSFLAFAGWWVSNHIRRQNNSSRCVKRPEAVLASGRVGQDKSLDWRHPDQEGPDLLDRLVCTDSDPAIGADIRNAMDSLPGDLRSLADLAFAGFTLEEIGEAFGYGRERVRQRLARACHLIAERRTGESGALLAVQEGCRSPNAVRHALGITDPEAGRLLRKLESQGRIRKDPEGQWVPA